MRMDPSLWFVQWFFWSCRVLDHFLGGYNPRSEKYKTGTNICHFFRTLMWGGIITIMVAGWYLWLFYVTCILPFMLFRVSSIGMLILLVVCILVVVAIIAATVFGVSKMFTAYMAYRATRDDTNSEPGFLTMTYLYLKAWKEKYCLIIEFKPETVNE